MRVRRLVPPRAAAVIAFAATALVAAALAACGPGTPRPADVADAEPLRPAQVVLLLARHLRDNDLVAFARDAAPASMQGPLEAAWRAGRTRWPLQALPFDERLPELLATLAAPGSEARLQAVFDQQFAGADAELRAAAAALGVFGVRYLEGDAQYEEAERDHYGQFLAALSRWGASAPLADPARARRVIPLLVAAARATGLTSDADFAQAGMQDSLRRLGPFMAATKAALREYGLDLDATLEGMEATLQSQAGDHAEVRMRYTLAGQPVDALVHLERRDGRWYLSEYLRQAEAATRPPRPGAA